MFLKKEDFIMTDFSSVNGKTVIITGSGSGMEKAMARTFAENGMQVVVADFNEQTGRAVTEEIQAAGYEASFIKTDVSDPVSVKAMVDYAVTTYGKLDGIVNNAGMGLPGKPIHEIELNEYRKVVGVDQEGVFYGMKYGAEAILKSKSKHGFIINTASTGGQTGTEGYTLYNSSKHAVIGMTKCAALDYAKHNITVNAICPGPVRTEIWAGAPQEFIDSYAQAIPVKRLAETYEIANLALFLASDLARFITGTTLVIDGGMTTGNMQYTEWADPAIDQD